MLGLTLHLYIYITFVHLLSFVNKCSICKNHILAELYNHSQHALNDFPTMKVVVLIINWNSYY